MKSKANLAKAPGLADLRAKMAAGSAPRQWRGLDQIAETDEFLDYLHREFPVAASEWHDEDSRREFLRVMAASLALAGVAGCSYQPQEKIVPYVTPPEEMVQGKPLQYATAMTLRGFAMGLVAESNQGRPTKIEGNREHPASLGATDIFAQASILDLYDPDRSNGVLRYGRLSSWEEFQEAIAAEFERRRNDGSTSKVRILTGAVGSPTLTAQLVGLLEDYPGAKWYQYEPVSDDNAREGARLAFGRVVSTRYKLDGPKTIVSLDSDFLCEGPDSVPLSRAFADGRDPDRDGETALSPMNRLYAIESSTTLTGAKADHRVPLKPSQVADFAFALASALKVEGVTEPSRSVPESAVRFVQPIADDLLKAGADGVVMVGRAQPPVVHALAHAINARIGSVGKAVEYAEPVIGASTSSSASLATLVQEINDGQVELLVMIGVNPVYDGPADLDFLDALDRVPLRVHAGLHVDETGERCHWHVPLAHFLEAWGDGRAFDGTVTIQQPLIKPLYGGMSDTEIVAALRRVRNPDSRGILEEYWKKQLAPTATEAVFAQQWRKIVHDGLQPNTASPAVEVLMQPAIAWTQPAGPSGEIELLFAPDPTIFDGRFANNGWLQECPKPLTKLTWDNALHISPRTAERLGLSAITGGQLVNLTSDGRTLEVATWIDPAQPDDAVVLHLGYGRTKSGRVGTPRPGQGGGFNAYKLRASTAEWIAADVQITGPSGTYVLATTQTQRTLDGRDLLREFSFGDYDRAGTPEHETHISFYDHAEWDYSTGYKWGMAVDLARCTGCSACIVACQSENNIAVVGKDQVHRNRAMHWLEVDRYYASEVNGNDDQILDNPRIGFQPRFCMHCENAPCEVVCPVGATVHDHEGLNNMVYNRCVGTRYCSNNCPYKVRKFNFLKFTNHALKSSSPTGDMMDSPLTLAMNPDVTVRPRGVMEKCTYCVQRIYEAKIPAEIENRPVRDGEIITACQQSCPANALVFGDLNDKESRVRKLHDRKRTYGMLTELNTRPRTRFLAGLRNPNPALVETV